MLQAVMLSLLTHVRLLEPLLHDDDPYFFPPRDFLAPTRANS
jgi:hypothetical protein